MFSGKLALIAIVAFAQVSILSGMIVLDSLPYMLGETIRLKVIPVDPRDLFRGDYVILGYDFTNPDFNLIAGLNNTDDSNWRQRTGETVYVTLNKPAADKDAANNIWTTKRVSLQLPEGGTFLCGTLHYNQLDCGIEAYYVQEGEGRRIEEAIRSNRKVAAEIVVWRGQAKLKRVIVN